MTRRRRAARFRAKLPPANVKHTHLPFLLMSAPPGPAGSQSPEIPSALLQFAVADFVSARPRKHHSLPSVSRRPPTENSNALPRVLTTVPAGNAAENRNAAHPRTSRTCPPTSGRPNFARLRQQSIGRAPARHRRTASLARRTARARPTAFPRQLLARGP